jgi:NAD(P)-dependent dehydrogenase (short-subunit alcohol dehydrogenase family)
MANFAADSKYPAVAPICRAEQSDVLSLFNLTGKTAVITGGNGGIGGGMARGLAEAGADIIIIQLPGEKSTFATELSAATNRRVDVYDCDLAKPEYIQAVVADIIERDGRTVDILCNCAGIGGGFVSILEETDAHRELAGDELPA